MNTRHLPSSQWPVLIQLMIGGRPEDPRRDGLERLCSEVADWDAFGFFCQSHGVAPLVSKCLPAIPSIPQKALKIFEDITDRSLARSTVLIHRLREILYELKSQNVAALVLKGPVFAETIYPSPVLRPFEDLDILIRREEMDRAASILKRTGFSEVGSKRERRFIESGFHRKFRSPDGAVVELHWELLHPDFRALPANAVWEEARDVTLYGTNIQTLSPHDEFIYACAHLAKHLSSYSLVKGIWISDLQRLLPHRISSALKARIARLRCRRMVLLAVALVNRFNKGVPLTETRILGRALGVGPLTRKLLVGSLSLSQVFSLPDRPVSWRRKLLMRCLLADHAGTIIRFPVAYMRRHLSAVAKVRQALP